MTPCEYFELLHSIVLHQQHLAKCFVLCCNRSLLCAGDIHVQLGQVDDIAHGSPVSCTYAEAAMLVSACMYNILVIFNAKHFSVL